MKIFKTFLLFAIMSLAIISCSSDDDNNNVEPSLVAATGQFTFDGTDYNLRSGIIEDYGTEAGVSNFDISLFSKEFDVQNEDQAFDGNVDELYFEIFTEEANTLPNGTYTFSNSNTTAGTFSISSGLELDFDYDTDEGGTYFSFSAGTVTVIQNGPVYELEFTLTTSDDKSIIGSYKGALISF